MVLWVVRAGRGAINADYALQNRCVGIGWDELGDLSQFASHEALHEAMTQVYEFERERTLSVWSAEVWKFSSVIDLGDYVILPRAGGVLALGEVVSEYQYTDDAPIGMRNQRRVEWLAEDFQRANLDADLNNRLNSTLTVFSPRDIAFAHDRIVAAILAREYAPPPGAPEIIQAEASEEEFTDYAEAARERIKRYITDRFPEHDLARLVGSVLQARGYKVILSKPGPDGGVDLIAGRGELGFESPRLVVQVKSGKHPTNSRVIREFIGVFDEFKADQGLFVSWGGYNSEVERQERRRFFQVRFWDADDLVSAIEETYDRLPSEIRLELPLQRLWVLAEESER